MADKANCRSALWKQSEINMADLKGTRKNETIENRRVWGKEKAI